VIKKISVGEGEIDEWIQGIKDSKLENIFEGCPDSKKYERVLRIRIDSERMVDMRIENERTRYEF
jgi:hypothetical protein